MALPQQPNPAMTAVYIDTTVKKDSTTTNTVTVNDLKSGFRNMLDEALNGVNGAKLNPMAVSFVQNYISKNKRGYESMKQWGQPYFTMMETILEEHGIPKEMKYLSVIESGLKSNALSSAGALGPWAFMPATARLYGLRVNGSVDERTNYFKSTHAAARLLTDLYARYGDWLLVIAAYNGGTGNVDKAIRKSGGSKDFWTLQYFLPNESMNHVKKFIGTHYIFEGEGGITTVTKDEMKSLLLTSASKLSEEEMNKTTAYDITGRFTSEVILKYTGVDRETFDHYNPNFDNEVALNGKYNLRLPIQKMNIFVAKRYEILDESLQSLLKAAK
jgi:membrane-bound lytic murein transglycosylase D